MVTGTWAEWRTGSLGLTTDFQHWLPTPGWVNGPPFLKQRKWATVQGSLNDVVALTRLGDMPRKPAKPKLDTYSGRLGARIRELRNERGWPVEQFWLRLDRAGVKASVATINNWEAGRRAPHLDDCPAIAKVLGVAILELLPPK